MSYAAVSVSYRCGLCLLACAAALSACDSLSDSGSEAATAGHGDQVGEDGGNAIQEPSLFTTADGQLDLSGGAWRVIEVPAASNQPSVVHTPDGWFALSSRTFGGKAVTGAETALYRSDDGVSWDRVVLDDSDDLQLNSLAYGNGHYVMMGRRNADGVVWASDDAQRWSERSQNAADSTQQLGHVRFVGGRFLAFGFLLVGVSDDGLSWEKVSVDLVQMMGVAHGNGRFLALGSGPVITSADGSHWQTQTLDCASLPDTCIVDPSGVTRPAILASVLFAEGRFFAGLLASSDGVAWSQASSLAPSAYVEGHFFASDEGALASWTHDDQTVQTIATVRPAKAAVTASGRSSTSIGVLPFDAALPDHVDVPFDDGLTCATSPCVLIDGRLYLVPQPGTPPLPDRVPRNADSGPLLSDDCPYSSMIFCDDYEKRSACRCQADAPSAPSGCEDVGQFSCEGAFIARDGEWPLAEIAEAGCGCNGSDPNQPPTFGLHCGAGATPRLAPVVCQAPLACLPVQAPPSEGPPGPQPMICTAPCKTNADCPSWEATGFCAGPVMLDCVAQACQPRRCN